MCFPQGQYAFFSKFTCAVEGVRKDGLDNRTTALLEGCVETRTPFFDYADTLHRFPITAAAHPQR